MKKKIFSIIGIAAFAVAMVINVNLNVSKPVADIMIEDIANAHTIICEKGGSVQFRCVDASMIVSCFCKYTHSGHSRQS